MRSTLAASALAALLFAAPSQDAPAPKDPATTTPWHAEPVLEKKVTKNVAVYNHADATLETATVAALAQQQYEFLEKYTGGAPRWVLVHVGNKYECGFSMQAGPDPEMFLQAPGMDTSANYAHEMMHCFMFELGALPHWFNESLSDMAWLRLELEPGSGARGVARRLRPRRLPELRALQLGRSTAASFRKVRRAAQAQGRVPQGPVASPLDEKNELIPPSSRPPRVRTSARSSRSGASTRARGIGSAGTDRTRSHWSNARRVGRAEARPDGRKASMASCTACRVFGAFVVVALATPSARGVQDTIRVSVDSAGAEGNLDSWNTGISTDGRFVVFESWASNLVASDKNNSEDVFLFDRATATIERVSVDSAGKELNGTSTVETLQIVSDDGSRVAFGPTPRSIPTTPTASPTSTSRSRRRHDDARQRRLFRDQADRPCYYGALCGTTASSFFSCATNLVVADTTKRRLSTISRRA